jgi:diadenylate cyclase
VLDADVSKELLYTIFIPSFENPLHDGAVIVRDGRVWQAGAFLPLAGTANRDRTLGARHRAALGITEESDAVVVVVSEERGAMSLCFDGNIVRGLDAPSMRDALFGLFYRTTDRRASRSDMGRGRENTGRISVTPSAAPTSGHTTLPPREPIDAGVPEAPLPSTPTRPEDRR